ncbi:MAG TPA: hypothetical protein VLZ77_15785 [Acidimicrobiales bacterium]|nr:hypothetical protein [Acidimicrobiales bacterium]
MSAHSGSLGSRAGLGQGPGRLRAGGPPAGRLRLAVSPAERRVLRGYGPLAGLLVAFILMAAFVPSIAREQDVVSQGSGGASSVSLPGTAAAAGGGAAGTAGSAAGAGTTGHSAGTAARPGAVASGAAATTPCPGRTLQVPGDPYSPPCIAFSGSDGGATSQGVTGSTINVSYRVTSDGTSFQQQLAALGGAQFADTQADINRTILGLQDYFNKNFQFYGRKLNIQFFNGHGSITNELLGQGQQQADADAVTAGQQMHAFAELNGVTEPYDDALAQQHVLAFGAPYLSANWMGQRAPYEWSVATECNDVATTASEFGTKMLGTLSGHTSAAYAGGSLKGQPRKYAIIAPDNPWYQDCANAAAAYGNAHGTPITDDVQYQLDLSTLSSQAASVVSKLANDGITTVYCGCDPIFPIYLTSRAHEQGYYPEWVVVGVALTDTDIVGQLFDQSEWQHGFGVSYAGPTLPKAATLGYAAYKSVRSDEPANEVNLIYEQMYQMAIGIEMAGPDLTPQTFQTGMRAYPGSVANASNAEFGTWKFPAGHYSPQVDSTIIYWNPTKTSPYNGKQGAYVVASPRYQAGQYPTGPPPLPAGFGG